jgi:hypothetical protein
MAANLVLGRALQVLEAAGGMVVFQDADGRWNKDSFSLAGKPAVVDQVAPVLEAVLEWTLYTEKPLAIGDLAGSRWARHLMKDSSLPRGAIAATPLAQRGAIWGGIALYRRNPVPDLMPFLGQLAELATEPLSSLGAARPEGIR